MPSDHALDALGKRALAVLGQPGYKLSDEPLDVPDRAGLYAVFGSAATWRELELDPSAGEPLYIGKAEVSLATRDVKTHFRDGRTGQSTVRRTFAALLQGKLGLTGIPRNTAKPGHFANYGLSPADDNKLSAWMRDHLTLAVWEKPLACEDLGAVEREVIRYWCPPLNIRDNRRSKWGPKISAARRAMRDQARGWAPPG